MGCVCVLYFGIIMYNLNCKIIFNNYIYFTPLSVIFHIHKDLCLKGETFPLIKGFPLTKGHKQAHTVLKRSILMNPVLSVLLKKMM